MRNRILKRPMFRLGGSAENEGIMDGMRRRYSDGTGRDEIVQNTGMLPRPKPEVKPEVKPEKERPSFRDILVNSPNLSPFLTCLLYTSPSPRDGLLSRMPSSA